MSNIVDFPRQRQVYLSKALKQSGYTKKRPVVIVSLDIRNEYSSTVLVVPFSSDTSQAANPSRVSIGKGEGGLNADSVAMCDVLTNIEKRYLERGPYGEITAESFTRIQRAIQIAIGIF
ncbi:type II toxin-antitoxin system PemK/MazF family toxin [Pleurocapsales cyanobacterium LEGE 06147]|nr:type II toxin-antitoxin system PemK/MazF family toxin [Pleurocapsales cyanobacterium LEGE 06147]